MNREEFSVEKQTKNNQKTHTQVLKIVFVASLVRVQIFLVQLHVSKLLECHVSFISCPGTDMFTKGYFTLAGLFNL